MRIKKRRLIAGGVVATAGAFAACVVNETKTSTTEQGLHFEVNGIAYAGSAFVSCGSATVNGGAINCPPLTIVADPGDSWLLTAIDDSACASTIVDADGSGLPVSIACTGGAGTGVMQDVGSGFGCIPTSYVVNAKYIATGPGAAACTVVAKFENPAVPGATTPYSISYSGYGNAPTSGITVSPTNIDFGQVANGAPSNPVAVTVKNIGSSPVSVNASTGAPYAVNYVSGGGSGSGTSASLGTGSAASATFNVICSSPMGSNDGTLTFTPSGGGSAQTVTLHCSYVDSTLKIAPSPISFAPTLVHASPSALEVTISSSGSDTLTSVELEAGTSADVTLDGGFTTGSGGATARLLGSYDVTVHYNPTTVHSGSLGRLELHTQDSATVRYVEIAGTAQNAKVAAAPNAIEFGPVCAGTTKTQDFEVYAEAEGSFSLNALDQPDSPFTVTGQSLASPMDLGGNHANAAKFTATLTADAIGEQSSTMTLHTSLPPQLSPTLAVPLHATVLAAGVSSTPSDVDFGANPVDTPTFARMVTLSNCGAAAKVTAVRITGVDAGEFAVIDPVDPLVEVEQFGKLELRLIMFPKTPGAKIAQLEIEYEGGTEPVIVKLDGAAFGANGGSDGDLGTYYTCSAGGAAGALPVGLALLLVRRRRRRQA